jgi:hypothetical protein
MDLLIFAQVVLEREGFGVVCVPAAELSGSVASLAPLGLLHAGAAAPSGTVCLDNTSLAGSR